MRMCAGRASPTKTAMACSSNPRAPGTDLALSLLPYDTLTIEAATHQDELPKPRHMFLRMLAGQMGVGGDDSWGAPVHDRYQLDAARELTLDVTMRLV